MKRTLYILLACCFTFLGFAQGIQINSSPIYYLNEKVGIGNSSPSSTLHINTYGSAALRFTRAFSSEFGYEIGATTFGLFDYTNSKYMWRTDNGNVLLVESSGNVGIGTTSPLAKLHIDDTSGQKHRGLILSGSWGSSGTHYNLMSFKATSWLNEDVFLDNSSEGQKNFHLGIVSDNGYFNQDRFSIIQGGVERFVVDGYANAGNVGIGTTSPTEKLSVNGTVLAKKVRVSADGGDWPDFVFAPNFKLRTLNELEAYIKTNQHLPEVPSAKEVEENGLDLGKMDATLLQKVEELTLYTIEQEKKIKQQERENLELKARLTKIEELIKTLTSK
tara:strand:+ start:881 stop:1876 length:996 start_codon:yes stop_codon:yes gene_type:complete